MSVKIKFLHPYRCNSGLRGMVAVDCYDVHTIFEVRTLLNWNVVLLSLVVLGCWFAAGLFASRLPLVLYGPVVARREKADIYYARDSKVVYWLVRLGSPALNETERNRGRCTFQAVR